MAPPFPMGSNLDPRVSPIRRTVGSDPVPLVLVQGSAVATPANYAAYSLDGGTTFNECVVPATGVAGWFGAAYSPSLGYAIMVGATGIVERSFDGITWAAMPGNDLTNGNWQGGCVRNADDTLFVTTGLGGTAGLRAATSPDGATWTLRVTPNTANGSAFGTRLLVAPSGRIIAVGSGSVNTPFISSTDGGITWGYLAGFGVASDNQDFAIRSATDYMHAVGFTGANAGDSFFSPDLGVTTWTRCLRDAANDPPNSQAVAIDPLRGHVYAAGSQGILRVNAGDPNNPVNNGWTMAYAAGVVGGGCRGGYISQLDRILFGDHSASAGFRIHQNTLSVGVWSTQDYATLLVNTARVKIDFLPFPT